MRRRALGYPRPVHALCLAMMAVSTGFVMLGSPGSAVSHGVRASAGAVINISASSTGGVGTFSYQIDSAAGEAVASATVKTTREGKETLATPPSIDVPAGTYRITQGLPVNRTGKWRVNSAICNGVAQSGDLTSIVVEATGQGVSCSFAYELVPQGSIRIRKTSFGGVGKFDYLITRGDANYRKSANTVRAGEPAIATGDSTSALDLGTYTIRELTPTANAGTVWQLNGLQCNGEATPTQQGSATVRLTADDPDLECSFVNELVADGDGNPSDPAGQANLSVTKRVSPKRIRSGRTVLYVVTVTNRGPSTAKNVTLTEQVSRGAGIVSFSGATCRRTPFPTCSIGTLRAGSKRTVRVRVRPRGAGRLENRVAVNSANPETSTRDNTASAFITVLSNPDFTG